MRRTRSGWASAQRPVMPKLAVMPLAASVSRIVLVNPSSEPASNVNATTRAVVGKRVTIVAPRPVAGEGAGGGGKGVADRGAGSGAVDEVGGAVVLGRVLAVVVGAMVVEVWLETVEGFDTGGAVVFVFGVAGPHADSNRKPRPAAPARQVLVTVLGRRVPVWCCGG